MTCSSLKESEQYRCIKAVFPVPQSPSNKNLNRWAYPPLAFGAGGLGFDFAAGCDGGGCGGGGCDDVGGGGGGVVVFSDVETGGGCVVAVAPSGSTMVDSC